MYQSQIRNIENYSFVDLFPIQFGKAKCPSGHAYGPFSRINFLFHFVLNGSGEVVYTENNTHFHVKSGEGFLIPPNTIASYKANIITPWEYCWIEFNGVKAQSILYKMELDIKNPIYQLDEVHPDKISKIGHFICNMLEGDNPRELLVLSNLYGFFDTLAKYSSNNSNELLHYSSPIYSQLIQKAITYIKHHFHDDISIMDIADFVSVNTYQLNRLFKKEIGVTPHQFLINYRLTYAKRLIIEKGLSIKETAHLSGFTNQYYFSTCFKHNVGMSPTEWAKSLTHSNA